MVTENSHREKFRIQVHPNFEKEEYKQAVDRMIRYIIEGDIYIANMTQQLTIESEKPPLDVFYDLRKNNPSPFGGYLDFGDYQIVCASPERFLKMKDRHVNTRPIKGTRKRGVTSEEDEMLRRELQDSGKDKSELLMIVDLERNDLNRVCTPGSVKVTELFTVEAYARFFIWYRILKENWKKEKNVMDLLKAAFPGGSITGAPKYRAMEIIDELEHGKRNLYTGSIGYLTLDGSCDFNIVIRTALHKNGNITLALAAGSQQSQIWNLSTRRLCRRRKQSWMHCSRETYRTVKVKGSVDRSENLTGTLHKEVKGNEQHNLRRMFSVRSGSV